MEDDPNFFEIEDNLNIHVNGRQPQFHSNDLDILVNGNSLKINNAT